MCGISGWLTTLESGINVEILGKMNNIAAYRGPDDEGYYVALKNDTFTFLTGNDSVTHGRSISDYNECSDVFLGMGHRRLSILDLSEAGHQPMAFGNNNIIITFNGEIYNYIEIRNELITKGYSFRTETDTEVILAAYNEWGEDCVERFNGMWAFVIHDRKKRELFCSRDRLGVKPFHYYYDGKNFIFASELKQLCQNHIIPRKMNERQLAVLLTYGITDYSEETLIESIKTLRGGNNLVLKYSEDYRLLELNIYKYWDINTKIKSEEAIDNVFNVLDEGIKIRMRSDVPVGILLSGGLDSSILTAKVSQYYKSIGVSPQKLQTFTSCYNNYEKGNERQYASEVNRYCSTTEHLIWPDEKETFELYKDLVWHCEGDAPISLLGAYMTLRESAQYGCKVMINGQGSDELMFGYERYYVWYLLDILKADGLMSFLKESKNVIKNSVVDTRTLALMLAYWYFPKVRGLRCYNRMRKYISSPIKREFKNNKQVEEYLRFRNMSDLLYNELRNTQLTHILRYDDRLYMANSIESRVPFVDYKYVEEAIKIPERCKISNGYTKYLLRKNMEGKLPDSVIWRKNKMGWPSPEERWVGRLEIQKVEELFQNPRSKKYFDVDKIFKRWKKRGYCYQFDKFLNVELFMRLFDVTA
jgi:asparagine synthase (glutamine-hydrolysing)